MIEIIPSRGKNDNRTGRLGGGKKSRKKRLTKKKKKVRGKIAIKKRGEGYNASWKRETNWGKIQ